MLIDPKFMRFYARLSAAVLAKFVLAIGGAMLGARLDRKFGTYPWIMISLLIVGVSLGLWYVIYVANQPMSAAPVIDDNKK